MSNFKELKIFATNIEWDFAGDIYEEDLGLLQMIPDKMEIPESFWSELGEDDYEYEISNYISNTPVWNDLRFCHQGFDIEFNFTQEELEEKIESLEKEIEKTWEDAKASELEEEKELLGVALCIYKEEQERNVENCSLDILER